MAYFNFETNPSLASAYHVIACGSLLGVAVNRKKFSSPVGKVDMKTLYLMDL